MHVRRLRTGTLARSGAGRRIRAIGVAAAVLATALVAGAPPAPPAGAVPPRPADGRYHVVTVASSGSGQLAVDDLAAGQDGRMWYSAPAFATWAIGALTVINSITLRGQSAAFTKSAGWNAVDHKFKIE